MRECRNAYATYLQLLQLNSTGVVISISRAINPRDGPEGSEYSNAGGYSSSLPRAQLDSFDLNLDFESQMLQV